LDKPVSQSVRFGSAGRIDFGGDTRLAEALVEGLRELLFGDVVGTGGDALD
jgi:hypothetical protein